MDHVQQPAEIAPGISPQFHRLNHQGQYASAFGPKYIRKNLIPHHGGLGRRAAHLLHGPEKPLCPRLSRMAQIGNLQAPRIVSGPGGLSAVGEQKELHPCLRQAAFPLLDGGLRVRLSVFGQGIVQISQQ